MVKVKKVNPWLVHVKKIKKIHPKKQLKEVLKIAKVSYKKK